MSYALRLAAEAKQGLAALPVAAQEEALDLLDGLTAESRIGSRPRASSRQEVFDLVTDVGGRRYYVLIVVRFDHRSQTVSVDSIGHVARG